RPWRGPLDPERACRELRAEAKAGRLDPDAVEAVATASERPGRAAPRVARPGGLTARQVEVLRLMAGGLSNRDIGRALHVTTRTAEHHVQDVYARIGVSSRAAAAVFAMQHSLLA